MAAVGLGHSRPLSDRTGRRRTPGLNVIGIPETLRGAGVRVLSGEGEFVPKAPKESDRAAYPWEVALGAVEQAWVVESAIVQAFWGQSVRPCPDHIAEEAVPWNPSR